MGGHWTEPVNAVYGRSINIKNSIWGKGQVWWSSVQPPPNQGRKSLRLRFLVSFFVCLLLNGLSVLPSFAQVPFNSHTYASASSWVAPNLSLTLPRDFFRFVFWSPLKPSPLPLQHQTENVTESPRVFCSNWPFCQHRVRMLTIMHTAQVCRGQHAHYSVWTIVNRCLGHIVESIHFPQLQL